MLSLTRRCPFHLIYKRETQGAKRRARLYFAATAVLIIAGAVVPACVTGIMHQRAHERSQQADSLDADGTRRPGLTGMK